ncbi:methylmalonyl Co-A mutase-associated GTPase MeaB [Actinomadura alba]|uniref:methylmalonyl Co-A mutase-associated GTPase MeaB n=1 Tax=Actinomadura alba TaxID=406431 RepID=UPI0028B1AD5A|nr:methylmalonyl Co-A mutase-associated GTPase MeaB [Actinomadura alba]
MFDDRDVAQSLAERARQGDIRAVARLLTIAEQDPASLEGVAGLREIPSDAQVIGITGPPGAGKSTLIGALVTELRTHDHRIGVLAVDPSSPLTAGALLGDRIRMQSHAHDDGVFIRSLASRGQLGGVSAVTPLAIRILLATGHHRVVVETVGVGQSEVEIAQLADTTVVVMAPGLGDGVQAGKAGLMEVADIYVVNKADRDGATEVRRQLQSMISWGRARGPGDWRRPIVMTTSTTGDGVEALADEARRHHVWLRASGSTERRTARAMAELEAAMLQPVSARLATARADGTYDALITEIVAGQLDGWTAAKALRDDASMH